MASFKWKCQVQVQVEVVVYIKKKNAHLGILIILTGCITFIISLSTGG